MVDKGIGVDDPGMAGKAFSGPDELEEALCLAFVLG